MVAVENPRGRQDIQVDRLCECSAEMARETVGWMALESSMWRRQPVAVAAVVDDVAAVEQRGCHDLVVEDLASARRALVRGEAPSRLVCSVG